MKAAADHGATFTAYTFIRLNGAVKLLFHDWLHTNFPDRAEKVWHLVEQAHGGQVNDSQWGRRMRGEGSVADLVYQQYKKVRKTVRHECGGLEPRPKFIPKAGEQGRLF